MHMEGTGTKGWQSCGLLTSQVICITGLYKRLSWIPPAASTHVPITEATERKCKGKVKR